MLDVDDLYSRVNIPLPSKPLLIDSSDNEQIVCEKLDKYFDDIIKCYPHATQSLLRTMYYDNKNILLVEKSFEKESQSNWELAYNGDVLDYRMVIDSRLNECPVIIRWNKIHEIAGHIGQAHQRIDQVGLRHWLEEINNGAFHKFTEQSVALSEKILLDALPRQVIERDLLHIGERFIRESYRNEISMRKSYNVGDYVRLTHRQNGCEVGDGVTEIDHIMLIGRPDIKKFMDCFGIDLSRSAKNSSWVDQLNGRDNSEGLSIGAVRTEPKKREGGWADGK